MLKSIPKLKEDINMNREGAKNAKISIFTDHGRKTHDK